MIMDTIKNVNERTTYKTVLAEVRGNIKRPSLEQESKTSRMVVVAGVAGLLGVLALVNYMGKKT